MNKPSPLAPGQARCPRGITTQQVIHRDGRPVPPVFSLESPRFLGDQDLPFERYTSQDFFDLEMEKMWPRVWQWACREEHIPEPGDYYVYEIGDYSILIVRDDNGVVNAYVNSCLHRGTKLKRGEGSSKELRCPFHGWTWSLEGDLKHIPCAWDAPHVDPDKSSLPRVKVGLWGGFVFINMDENAEPFEDYIAPIPKHFEPYQLENRFIEVHIEKEFSCNWKSGIEAFMENYHTQETHPQLLTANYDEPTQYDIFGDNVSRFLSAYGISSTHLKEPLTEDQLMEEVLVSDRSKLDELGLSGNETARIALARILRQTLGEAYGVDLSRFTDTEMIDVAQYNLFPNAILFPGLSLPFAYRIRPIGNDPDRCLFELFILRECAPDRERPPAAEPVRLKEEDSFSRAPGFDPLLAKVFDQDTGNLHDLQKGMKASRKPGATLLNYQEVRIRLLHQTLDKYLNSSI